MPASSVDWPYTAGLWREIANQDTSHLGTYSAAAVPAPGATRTVLLGDGRDSGSTTDRASGSRRGHNGPRWHRRAATISLMLDGFLVDGMMEAMDRARALDPLGSIF
jgi:hypothetical protein